jgi:hypothetical protein
MAKPLGGGQDDLGPPDMLLRAVAIGDHRLQAGASGGRNLDGDPFAHPTQIGSSNPDGNHSFRSVH